ncbi:CbrC family protein [Bacillus cereus group sp. BfR-BA-01319]|uniref:CbrC family protein n=1 Tax=Bacillus cereus group sp. BfR-BA-01319 TaxID=2920296 RepID=UPI0035C8DDE7
MGCKLHIEKIINEMRITKDDFKRMLQRKGYFTGYLFQCIHCSKAKYMVICQ